MRLLSPTEHRLMFNKWFEVTKIDMSTNNTTVIDCIHIIWDWSEENKCSSVNWFPDMQSPSSQNTQS